MAVNLWSVVLAGGSGRRLAAITQGVPKQFWRLGGRRSLLETTFARIGPLSPPERTTVVVDRTHEPHVRASAMRWPADWILYQPEDRGTAAGVLLALSPILESDPDAIVLLTPSDHGVRDGARFRAGVREAVDVVSSGQVDAVLFGVESAWPATDYGWISPGCGYQWAAGRPLRRIARFVEKPPGEQAHHLHTTGALWNTMVLVARADTLLALYRASLPQLAEVFATLVRLPTHARQRFLVEQYAELPTADFSRDVLAPAQGLAVYTWQRTIGWSDLGTPGRLQQWLGDEAERLNRSVVQPRRVRLVGVAACRPA